MNVKNIGSKDGEGCKIMKLHISVSQVHHIANVILMVLWFLCGAK